MLELVSAAQVYCKAKWTVIEHELVQGTMHLMTHL